MQLTSYRRFPISTVDHGYSLQNAQVYILQGAFLFLIALPDLMINRGPGGAFGFLEVSRVRTTLTVPRSQSMSCHFAKYSDGGRGY
jgi:hypothetical protein